jgi:hypothetical protein
MEQLPGPSGPGTVVLDIGGDVGAAIIYTPASLDGEEVEIRALHEVWDGTHVAVRARNLPSGLVHAAVFESLVRGNYEVRVRGADAGPRCRFEVAGGRVTSERLAGV